MGYFLSPYRAEGYHRWTVACSMRVLQTRDALKEISRPRCPATKMCDTFSSLRELRERARVRGNGANYHPAYPTIPGTVKLGESSGRYVFSVAQIFNLPYRRFVIGRTLLASGSWQVKNLRYSRLQVCATGAASALNTYSGRAGGFPK